MSSEGTGSIALACNMSPIPTDQCLIKTAALFLSPLNLCLDLSNSPGAPGDDSCFSPSRKFFISRLRHVFVSRRPWCSTSLIFSFSGTKNLLQFQSCLPVPALCATDIDPLSTWHTLIRPLGHPVTLVINNHGETEEMSYGVRGELSLMCMWVWR